MMIVPGKTPGIFYAKTEDSMKVKVLKSFVDNGQFIEQTLTVEMEPEKAKKYEAEGLIKIIKEKPKIKK